MLVVQRPKMNNKTNDSGAIKSLVLLFSLLFCISTTAKTPNEKLAQLLDEIWTYELSQFPGLAKSEGKATQTHFTDLSPNAMQARRDTFQSFVNQLSKFDKDALDDSEQISLYMQKYRLQNYIDQFDFNSYRVPITAEFGFHSSAASQVTNFGLVTFNNLPEYISLLHAIPAFIEQNISHMRDGIKTGHVQPKAVLMGFESGIAAFVSENNDDAQAHIFFNPVKEVFTALDDAEQQQVISAIADANSAYRAFYQFFVDEYFPAAKENISSTTWPDGENYYKNRMRYYTTTDLSADEIHNIGLEEVKRIRSEMQAIIDELAFDGEIADFIQFLRTDEQFYASTPKELIVYASYVAKQMDAQLPKLFYKMPRTPYGVAPVPESIAPKYTTGRYVPPRRDDQPGYYWVNTYALDKRPLYAIPALTLHEAVPGHHFQISLAREMEDLPKVRQNTYISAFGEGWGLYSEYLGLEVGIYEDPYDNFGRLSYEMWRACRLVVDTGMHVMGWSRQKALDYMLENTALSEHNITTEIDRYISWPAQALSYKIGEIRIKQLREKAENVLGSHFDLRAFHDAILENGSVPLFILEEKMNAFINTQQAAMQK